MKSDDASEENEFFSGLKIMLLLRALFTKLSKKVESDHRSKFSNLSNWKEEAWKKNQGFNGIRTRDHRRVCGDAVLGYFWGGFAVIFILSRGIAVSKN